MPPVPLHFFTHVCACDHYFVNVSNFSSGLNSDYYGMFILYIYVFSFLIKSANNNFNYTCYIVFPQDQPAHYKQLHFCSTVINKVYNKFIIYNKQNKE